MNRKEFLKLSCSGCLLGATGWLSASGLLSCSPARKLSVYKTEVIRNQMAVPQTQLTNEVTIVRGTGMDYDIAVHKTGKPDKDAYEAMLLRCTHFNNPLTPTAKGFHCSLHGSEFDEKGQVKKGPASVPLLQLPCIAIGGMLVINVRAAKEKGAG